MHPTNVIIDCERMKYPFTGLYTYCSALSKSLVQQNNPSELKLHFYTPEKEMGFLGNDQHYYKQRSWHKLLNPIAHLADVWHGTYQNSNYYPTQKKVKKILTIHDLNFMVEGNKSAAKQKKYLNKLQDQIDRSDLITTISTFTLDFVKQHLNLHNIPTTVIYNGCNVDLIASPPTKPDFIHEADDFIFSIGTIARKKNFHVLIPLLKNNNFKLVIAGIFQDSNYQAFIMEEAKKYNVAERVIMPGSITESEKWWLMQHAIAFVFPSIAEGFGIPVAEAMHFDAPIILSTHTCLPEIGGDAAYYFSSFDPDEMQHDFKNALDHYNANSNQKIKMKARADLFNWENAANQYLNLYRKLI